MTVTLSDDSLSDEFTILGISTLADLGFYFRPFYQNLQCHKNIQLIAMTCSPLYIAFSLPKILFAKATNKSYIIDKSDLSIHLKYNQPQAFTLDGDLYTSKLEQHIELGPPVSFIAHPINH